jgi:hypothetical protein
MSDSRRPIPPPRARALAELPVDALLERADELARRWAIALILARPLEGIGGVPLEELAHDAPSLCEQTIRALHSDLELDRLTGSGTPSGRERAAAARSLGEMSGASDAPGLVAAVEALRGVLWEGLLEENRLPGYGEAGSRRLGDLGDRLAYVCTRMLIAALEAGAAVVQEREPGEQPPAAVQESGLRTGEGIRAVLVDERAEPARPAATAREDAEPVGEAAQLPRRSASPQRRRSAPPQREAARVVLDSADGSESAPARPLSWDESPPVPPVPPMPPEAPGAAVAARVPDRRWQRAPGPIAEAPREEIEIHDARGGEGPAAWVGAIGRQLERLREDGLPFAVLLVEPLHAEMLRLAEPTGEMLRLAGDLEDALALALRAAPGRVEGGQAQGNGRAPWSVSLTRERPGRYWLLAPETDRSGAERLAERLRTAVASVVEDRGAPLEIVIGTAVCPEDGMQAPALAAHADVGLYAARSARMRPHRRAPVDETA